MLCPPSQWLVCFWLHSPPFPFLTSFFILVVRHITLSVCLSVLGPWPAVASVFLSVSVCILPSLASRLGCLSLNPSPSLCLLCLCYIHVPVWALFLPDMSLSAISYPFVCLSHLLVCVVGLTCLCGPCLKQQLVRFVSFYAFYFADQLVLAVNFRCSINIARFYDSLVSWRFSKHKL